MKNKNSQLICHINVIFPYVRFLSTEIDMYFLIDYNYTFQDSLHQ